MNPSKRCTILCADDFGLTSEVSRAIEELARSRKLSATSVMTNLPDWDECRTQLPTLRNDIAVGLHLNLTTGEPLSSLRRQLPEGRFQSLNTVLLTSLARRWNEALLREEIQAQLQRFEEAAGNPPDHVDGHQHVHIFPVVRPIFLQCLQERYGNHPILFRNPSPDWRAVVNSPGSRLKSTLIKALSTGTGNAAAAAGFHTNDSFAGFSSFHTEVPFEKELKQALTSGQGLHMVMCHPGYIDDQIALYDSVVERREDERAAMMAMPLEHDIWYPVRDTTNGTIAWDDVCSDSRGSKQS
ncbi:ChbG/HpnK family deacetylase [Granulosicoccus sp. 3-233]|uniref:ChbG/HpnK family deacetylase n=1 Tax=Granulosicoccus sp. 3-233 TaxID=3417969 RepID=UPI003D328D03